MKKKFLNRIKKYWWIILTFVSLFALFLAVFLPRRSRNVVSSLSETFATKAQVEDQAYDTKVLIAKHESGEQKAVFEARMSEIEKVSDTKERLARLIQLKKEVMG